MNFIDADFVSRVVARISGTFQGVVNNRSTTWQKNGNQTVSEVTHE